MLKNSHLLLHQKILAWFAAIVGHQNCFLCHQSSHTLICQFCQNDIALPIFPSPAHNLLEYEKIHKNLDPPHYVSLHAIGAYEGVLAGLISKLKFSGQLLAGEVLADFFCRYLKQGLIQQQSVPDVLIPVPLSLFRYAKREFNQASMLCQHLSQAFHIPTRHAVIRNRHTKQQSSLDKDERLENIRNAFTLIEHLPHTAIALVDDVITTGATVNSVCKAILAEYPEIEIHVWCMAVTVKE